MESAVWIDGRLMPTEEAALAVDDHAIITGDGAFETLIALDHPRRTAFAISRHLERLHRSCEVLGIDVPHPDSEIRAAIDGCTTAAPTAGIVRITITSGRGPLSSIRGDGPGSTIVIAGGSRPSYESGTTVALFPHPRNERGVMAGVKTSSYAENVVALRHARGHGATESIFGNTRGELCEGTGTNVFWVEGGQIHTPRLDSGCLAGVTRALILEHLDGRESSLRFEALKGVPEAFLTSSTRVVQSIRRVDDVELEVVDGPATRAAADTMADLMATDMDP